MCPRAGLDECELFRPPPEFDPWTVQPATFLSSGIGSRILFEVFLTTVPEA